MSRKECHPKKKESEKSRAKRLKRRKIKRKKILRYSSVFLAVFVLDTAFLIWAVKKNPEYSDSTTGLKTGVVASVDTETFYTGYKSGTVKNVILTLDDGREFRFPFEYLKKNGTNYQSFVETVKGKEVEVRYPLVTESDLAQLTLEGETIICYDLFNQAHKISGILNWVLYFLILILTGYGLWCSYYVKKSK